MSERDGATRTTSAETDSLESILSGSRLLVLSVLTVLTTLGGLAVYSTFFTSVGCACTPAIPHAEFEFTHDADQKTVTVQHAGGDQFDAGETDRIEVRVDGEVWASIESALVAGDAVTVPASPGDRVEVVWFGESGNNSQVLASYTVER